MAGQIKTSNFRKNVKMLDDECETNNQLKQTSITEILTLLICKIFFDFLTYIK